MEAWSCAWIDLEVHVNDMNLQIYDDIKHVKVDELNEDSLVVFNVFSNNENGIPIGWSLVVKIRRLFELEWEVVAHHSYH